MAINLWGKRVSSLASCMISSITLIRFVRFVSTPEILERFLRTEQEISQIEKSIEVNEISSKKSEARNIEGSPIAVDGASKSDAEGAAKVTSEENFKSRLQRVLDTRKALLLKEQAMAFPRAKAAGFKIENMDDLTYFIDAFGATRLSRRREERSGVKERGKLKNSHKDINRYFTKIGRKDARESFAPQKIDQ